MLEKYLLNTKFKRELALAGAHCWRASEKWSRDSLKEELRQLRNRGGPDGFQPPRPESLIPRARGRSAPPGPGAGTKPGPGGTGPKRPPDRALRSRRPPAPYASGTSGPARPPPSAPRRWPRWPRSRPPHLRVRRHPAGADSGTASGALPGHSAGPHRRARPG